jgi:predicted DCC family thiol-disulfide oxidoreductase YuxK
MKPCKEESGGVLNIVFFDGVCGLCNRFVDFLLERDVHERLYFSPLQGKAIQESAAAALFNSDTIVFVKEDKVFTRSRAVIESIAMLGGFWVLMKLFLLIPGRVRDFAYCFIAKRRYRWFGKKQSCRIPSPKERKYFLE